MDGAGASNLLHEFVAVGAGAAGGFLGPLTLLAELPLPTLLMRKLVHS